MNGISSNGQSLGQTMQKIAQSLTIKTEATAEQMADARAEALESGLVQISAMGQALAGVGEGASANKNSDIDDSELPSEIKNLLKQIRELKEKIREQQEALQKVMMDSSLTPDERRAQVLQIQATVNSLNSALDGANKMLTKVMSEMNLSDADKAKVLTLMAK